jgi:hypothetical protein
LETGITERAKPATEDKAGLRAGNSHDNVGPAFFRPSRLELSLFAEKLQEVTLFRISSIYMPQSSIRLLTEFK